MKATKSDMKKEGEKWHKKEKIKKKWHKKLEARPGNMENEKASKNDIKMRGRGRVKLEKENDENE